MAEPEWDEKTRNLALALDAVDLCPVCRGPAYLCQDIDRQFDWKVGDPIRCHRRTALLERQARINDKENPHAEALVWPIQLARRG